MLLFRVKIRLYTLQDERCTTLYTTDSPATHAVVDFGLPAGSIPTALGGCSALEELRLDGNDLSGERWSGGPRFFQLPLFHDCPLSYLSYRKRV